MRKINKISGALLVLAVAIALSGGVFLAKDVAAQEKPKPRTAYGLISESIGL